MTPIDLPTKSSIGANRILVGLLLCVAGGGWIFQKHLESTAPNQQTAVAKALPPFHGIEILSTMKGQNKTIEDGAIVLRGNQPITSAVKYKPPIRFRITAMTDSTNIRIRYAANQMIFNWEANPDEFRIDGGPADGRNQLGAGRIPENQWVEIGIDVLPDSLSITVDGIPRYFAAADFSNVNQAIGLFASNGSVVRVRSVLVDQR